MSDFDADKLVAAMSAAVSLPIAAAHRPGVVMHLEAAHAAMERMKGFELDDLAEPAPVFRPDSAT